MTGGLLHWSWNSAYTECQKTWRKIYVEVKSCLKLTSQERVLIKNVTFAQLVKLPSEGTWSFIDGFTAAH